MSPPPTPNASSGLRSPLSRTTSDMETNMTKEKPQKRPPARRPSGPPPRRPTVAPPPPPNVSSARSAVTLPARSIPTIHQQPDPTKPPERPPQPSSDKIKAIEARKRQQELKAQNATEIAEDDYNDSALKVVEEFHPYSDIDDDTRKGNADATNLGIRPPPPIARTKQQKKGIGSQTFHVIASMKTKLGGRGKKENSDARKPTSSSIIEEQSTRLADAEEGVYAGIDDFPPQMKLNDDETMGIFSQPNRTANGRVSVTSQSSFDDDFDSD